MKDATTTLTQVVAWWQKWPTANIGVQTGKVSGLVVVDIDPRDGGDDSFDALEDEHGRFPDTVQSLTGGGGRHLLYAYPSVQVRLLGKLADGIDLKSDGGYIVAPGSIHVSGRIYEWEESSRPEDVDVASLPSWILEVASKPAAASTTEVSPSGVVPSEVLAGVPDGNRDIELFRYASMLRERGIDQVEAQVLVMHAAANCSTPFPPSKALEKVKSAYSRYPAGAQKELPPEVVAAWDALEEVFPQIEKDLQVAYSEEVFDLLKTISNGDSIGLDIALRKLRKQHDYNDLNDLRTAISDAARSGDLTIRHIGEWVADVDAAPDPGWVAKPVWPGDAYGVMAAESKAGKTWAALDLAVAKASGTKWMGVYPCEEAAPVLMFLGEGGERNTVRRLRAICGPKMLRLADLPLRFSFRVPHLGNQHHLDLMRTEIEEHPPGMIILDPLYLAASGASGGSLFDIAEYLQAAQHVAQQAGAALVIVHHYNQTGRGSGARRMSGAGPEEWGRVLAAVDLDGKPKVEADGATVVTLQWTFTGGEIGYHELTVRRTVRAEDPEDLTSSMDYTIEEVGVDEAADPLDAVPASAQEAYGVLARQEDGRTLTAAEVQQAIADERHDRGSNPMPMRTVQNALKKLREQGLAVSEGSGKGRPYLWKSTHEPRADTDQDDHIDSADDTDNALTLFDDDAD